MKRTPAILILVFLAAACTPYWAKDRENKFGKCPQVQLLNSARAYIDAPGDAWQSRAEISEFSYQCKITKTAADIVITLQLGAERARPADLAAAGKVMVPEEKILLPLFLATLQGNDILEKRQISQSVEFGENRLTNAITPEISVSLPFGAAGTAADRTVMIGFQLDAAQRKYIEKLRSQGTSP